MTTLHVDVGRHSSTTVEDVVEGLQRAGCMKYVEIDPDSPQYVPLEELRAALERAGFHVALVPWPAPPPLPWWARVRAWPRRLYWFARRVVLRESTQQQMGRALYAAYFDSPAGDAVHAASTRESPMLRMLQKQGAGEETFTLRGARAPAPDITAHAPRPVIWESPCPECGAILNHTPDCKRPYGLTP